MKMSYLINRVFVHGNQIFKFTENSIIFSVYFYLQGSLFQRDDGSVGTTAGASRRWDQRRFQTMESGTESTDPCAYTQTYDMYSHMHTDLHIVPPSLLLSPYQMKKKPVKSNDMFDEVDFNVPDYKTVIVISSKDQLNITLSKCGLAMLSNLGTVRSAAITLRESLWVCRFLWCLCFSPSPGFCWGRQTDCWLLPERWSSVCCEKPPGPAGVCLPQWDVCSYWHAE